MICLRDLSGFEWWVILGLEIDVLPFYLAIREEFLR